MQAPWPFSCQQSAKIEGIGLEGRVQLRLDEQEDLISDVVYEYFIFGGCYSRKIGLDFYN